MTEPLIVDPDSLESASAVLKSAAGSIPAPLPQLSVTGTDPLSMAIAAGAVQVEEPMGALPGIKADATKVAQNIGEAARRYKETDQLLAEKAKQHRFATGEGERGEEHGQLIGNAADGKAASKGFDWMPDGQGLALGGAGVVAGGATDAVREAAVKAMKEGATKGPGKASPGLVKFLDDVKIAGRTLKGVSHAGGAMSAVMAVPNVIADIGQGDSWRKAVTKEAGGALAGVAAGAAAGALVGSAVPVVGTVIGLGVGAFAGYWATEGIDTYWEPMANAVGSVKDGIGNAMRSVASVFSFG